MEQRQIKHKLTLEEYNQLEEDTGQRYEYHDGEVFAMAGAATDVGDPVHNIINEAGIYGLKMHYKPHRKYYANSRYSIPAISPPTMGPTTGIQA